MTNLLTGVRRNLSVVLICISVTASEAKQVFVCANGHLCPILCVLDIPLISPFIDKVSGPQSS